MVDSRGAAGASSSNGSNGEQEVSCWCWGVWQQPSRECCNVPACGTCCHVALLGSTNAPEDRQHSTAVHPASNATSHGSEQQQHP